jgi:hypothetical protein
LHDGKMAERGGHAPQARRSPARSP